MERSSARSASRAWRPTRTACAPRRESTPSSSLEPRPQGVRDVLRRAHAHGVQSRGARALDVFHRVVEEEDAIYGNADLASDRLEGRALGLAFSEIRRHEYPAEVAERSGEPARPHALVRGVRIRERVDRDALLHLRDRI